MPSVTPVTSSAVVGARARRPSSARARARARVRCVGERRKERERERHNNERAQLIAETGLSKPAFKQLFFSSVMYHPECTDEQVARKLKKYKLEKEPANCSPTKPGGARLLRDGLFDSI
eukprot:COSAG02_NODE_16_length_56207_cov_9.816122_32_plen_119_part_00